MMIVSTLGTAPAVEGEPAAPAGVVSERLRTALQGIEPETDVRVIVETHGDPAPVAAAAEAKGARILYVYALMDAFAARVRAADAPGLADLPGAAVVWDALRMAPAVQNSARSVEADRAWSKGFNGAGVTVAVIDTGIEMIDADLKAAVVACVSTHAGLISLECADTDGHGTHVAGVVASAHATHQGISAGARLAVVRVLLGGFGTSADVIAGMDWVAANKDKVSPPIRVAALTLVPASAACGDGLEPESKAADNLVKAGLSVAVASGNAGHAACTVGPGAAAFGVVTVGASDERGTPDPMDDTVAAFSSGGPTRDGRMKPDIVAPGVGIRSLFLGPSTAELDGTSFAAPHVAAVMGMMLQAHPSMSPAQVKARLLATALVPAAAAGLPDSAWGHGMLNACRALLLQGCAGGPLPDFIYVKAIHADWAHHGQDKHAVGGQVELAKADGTAAAGVPLTLELQTPGKQRHYVNVKTDAAGKAWFVKGNAGPHGIYRACVAHVEGPYDPSADLASCPPLNVAH